MSNSFLASSLPAQRLIGTALACALAWASPSALAAQEPAAGVVSAPGTASVPARLSGAWHFNKDASSPVPESANVPPAGGAGSAPPPGGGGAGGGGGYGGRGGASGGTGGGGYGGRGGQRGGGGSEASLQARAVDRELLPPPETLDIVATDSAVTFTSNDGTVRKFAVTGKAEKVSFGTAEVDVTTKWTANNLTQELSAGQLKAHRVFTVTDEGHQLVVSVHLERGGRDTTTAPLLFVYDRR